MISTAKILVSGRNFALLCERLRSRNVRLLKTEKTGGGYYITVDYRDLDVALKVTERSWHGTFTSLGGYAKVVNTIKKNLLSIALALIFILSAVLIDSVIFGVDIQGVTGEKRYKVLEIASDTYMVKGGFYNDGDVESLRHRIFKSVDGVDFVTVKKSGNRLIIGIICLKEDNLESKKGTVVRSMRSGKLLRLSVYSGTPSKIVGDKVAIKEELAYGYYEDKSGNQIAVVPSVGYLLECNFTTEYAVSGGFDEGSVYCRALTDGAIDETWVTSYDVMPVIVDNVVTAVKVKITYLYRGEYSIGQS